MTVADYETGIRECRKARSEMKAAFGSSHVFLLIPDRNEALQKIKTAIREICDE